MVRRLTQYFILILAFVLEAQNAWSLDLDWHGQFVTESNWFFGTSNSGFGTNTGVDQGYLIPNNGGHPVTYQTLFFKLQPTVLVNDNVMLHSDIWFGSPSNGVFGDTPSTSAATNQFLSSQAGQATISANTFYADVLTDLGTVTVGRAPLNWGLGVVWNNTNDPFSRFPSTGDTIRWTTKFGAFSFTPALTRYRVGSDYGGVATAPEVTQAGSSGATDYTLGLAYDNPDDRLNLGVMFMRRLAGSNQPTTGNTGVENPAQIGPGIGYAGYDYNLWDIYAHKGFGIFDFAAEAPITTGDVASIPYSSVNVAAEVNAKFSDFWNLQLKVGQAEGQADVAPGNTAPGQITAFSFHPDYRPGFLMFNYNYRNFSEPISGDSPYDDPVTNARYLNLSGSYSITKWNLKTSFTYGSAVNTATAGDTAYYNTWTRQFEAINAGAGNQSSDLGFELDETVSFQWDESTKIGVTTGLYLPGAYYEYSNSATNYSTSIVWGSTIQLSIVF